MSFKIKTQENETGTIIMLHGYGANAKDLEFLAKEWKQYFKTWNFVGIDGPLQLPNGHAWFELGTKKLVNDLISAHAFVEELFKEYKKPIIFVGFSQGAFLASSLAIYANLNIIGAISFCGGLIPLNWPTRNRALYIINGTEDQIMDSNWLEEGIQYGKKHNLNISGIMIEGMKHEINNIALAQATIQISKMIDQSIIIQ